MAITIKTRKEKDIPILSVSGRLISVDSEKFQKKLEGFCKKYPNLVVLDISEVNFIDSFGLGTLVHHHTQMQKSGGKLIVLNSNTDPNTYIQRLFSMTGLNRIFISVESLESLKQS